MMVAVIPDCGEGERWVEQVVHAPRLGPKNLVIHSTEVANTMSAWNLDPLWLTAYSPEGQSYMYTSSLQNLHMYVHF